MTNVEAKQVNPVTLAFLGDAVYTLWVREKLVKSGAGKPSDLQRLSAKIVSAHGQSAFLEQVLPMLTEEEMDVFKRGRNAKKPTKSKSATAAEYNRSTGFEAVLGFLHLTGQTERLEELLSTIDESVWTGQAASVPFKPCGR